MAGGFNRQRSDERRILNKELGEYWLRTDKPPIRVPDAVRRVDHPIVPGQVWLRRREGTRMQVVDVDAEVGFTATMKHLKTGRITTKLITNFRETHSLVEDVPR